MSFVVEVDGSVGRGKGIITKRIEEKGLINLDTGAIYRCISQVSAIIPVREKLVAIQRKLSEGKKLFKKEILEQLYFIMMI